jgi:GT2 family glycosyltransferase
VSFSVVILSANPANLIPCVRSLLTAEPSLSPLDIVVLDDGAREVAEPVLPELCWITGIKPFIFARNANLGITAARKNVFLMNDDACLVTPNGFTLLAAEAQRRAGLGICSAGIRGAVGNPRQIAAPVPSFRYETRAIAFVCVFIPWHIYMAVGPLDERFTGYGFEDNDYCSRIAGAGLKIGIWDGCVVDHGEHPSSFRSRSDITLLFEQNRQLYRSKWGREA